MPETVLDAGNGNKNEVKYSKILKAHGLGTRKGEI